MHGTGMYFLHSTSPPIIHRDLKSANILLNNNRAKVTGATLGLRIKHTRG
jgi:serine/threonine protein kinase